MSRLYIRAYFFLGMHKHMHTQRCIYITLWFVFEKSLHKLHQMHPQNTYLQWAANGESSRILQMLITAILQQKICLGYYFVQFMQTKS